MGFLPGKSYEAVLFPSPVDPVLLGHTTHFYSWLLVGMACFIRLCKAVILGDYVPS